MDSKELEQCAESECGVGGWCEAGGVGQVCEVQLFHTGARGRGNQ